MTATRSAVLDAALYYAARGWAVVPVIPREKRPSIPNWVEDATTDTDLIVMWWTANPNAGVGIVTGERSGIWVVDVDPASGGTDSLADLEHEHGRLPDTLESLTGGGGRHLIFSWPGWNPGTGAGRLGPGIDIRADGGFIVAPPTTHASGAQYTWELSSDPHDGLAPVPAPDWLLELCKPTPAPLEAPRTTTSARASDDHLPDWPSLLTASGATYAGTRTRRQDGTTYSLWCRPGKTPAEGTSATLGYGGTELLKVFTSNWPGIEPDGTANRFHYYALTHHSGDHARARRELDRISQTADLAALDIPIAVERATELAHTIEAVDEIADPRDQLIKWDQFWARDHTGEQWLAWPLITEGRGHALYAPAKAGKSTIILAAAVALATGTSIFGQTAQPPRHVLYCDYEMTEADLEERLEELGYGPDSDLTHLHYALLPSFQPLDTPAGAQSLLDLATAVDAALVIVDTFGRAVAGDENEADVVRAFYRLVGRPLKMAGRAWLRTDHAGKKLEAGQRGSSAKNDDVDVVWQISRTDNGTQLTRTHSRMSWVPDRVRLERITDGISTVWRAAQGRGFVAGTHDIVEALDTLDVPLDLSRRAVRALYKDQLPACRNEALSDAIRARRERGDHAQTAASRQVTGPDTGTAGTGRETPGQPDGTTTGTNGDHSKSTPGPHTAPYVVGAGTSAGTQLTAEDLI